MAGRAKADIQAQRRDTRNQILREDLAYAFKCVVVGMWAALAIRFAIAGGFWIFISGITGGVAVAAHKRLWEGR